MTKGRIISTLLTIFVTLPIWWYIVYTILAAVHPDRLVWFLFYIYIPVGMFNTILAAVAFPVPEPTARTRG